MAISPAHFQGPSRLLCTTKVNQAFVNVKRYNNSNLAVLNHLHKPRMDDNEPGIDHEKAPASEPVSYEQKFVQDSPMVNKQSLRYNTARTETD